MKSFRDKVAAITGAASGMGRTLALELARRGCHLALSDVNRAELKHTAEMASAYDVKITVTVLDVADRAAMYDWAGQVVRDHGRVNLIFNNAGVSLAAVAETVDIADFEWLMGINFWGVVHGTQAFMPHLRKSGDGHVVNTSSLFGLLAYPTQSPYNASKFAVRGYTEALRMELELEGAPVGVTCVHPGGVATNIARAGRVDGDVQRITGRDAEAHKRSAEKLIQTTTPESAALQILAGVQKNARRVLVGPDARRYDLMSRLFGAGYQVLVLSHVRKQAKRKARLVAANAS